MSTLLEVILMVTEPELAVYTNLIYLTAVEGPLLRSIIIKYTMASTMADMCIAQPAQFIIARYMDIMAIMLDQEVTMEKREVLLTVTLSAEEAEEAEEAVEAAEAVGVMVVMVDTLDKNKNYMLDVAVCSVTIVWMQDLDI